MNKYGTRLQFIYKLMKHFVVEVGIAMNTLMGE